jgi:hypothetical protein
MFFCFLLFIKLTLVGDRAAGPGLPTVSGARKAVPRSAEVLVALQPQPAQVQLRAEAQRRHGTAGANAINLLPELGMRTLELFTVF